MLAAASYAEDTGAACTISAAPLPDDASGGYRYAMTMACDHAASELHLILIAQPTNISDYWGDADDSPHCSQTGTTCNAEGRLSCLRPGTYQVYAAGWGLFIDTQDPTLRHYHSFDEVLVGGLSVSGIAQLSIDFQAAPGQPDKVQAVVTYTLPQQYYYHWLHAFEFSGNQFFQDVDSPLLPLTGKWTIPVALTPGRTLAVRPGQFCGDDLAPRGTSANLRVTVPQVQSSDYTAVAQILDGSPAESKSGVQPGTPFYAQVPLGLELRLGIQKKGTYIPAKFDLTPATLTGLATPTLYPTNAVLEYGRTVHEPQKTFRGVHLGTQTLTVTPDDSTIRPFILTLGVFDPGALGNTEVQYDPQFVQWGNKRGIPPHVLKGLIRQEGPFEPFEYRYEPLSGTTGDRLIQKKLTELPYASYLLATSTNLPKGALLLDFNAGNAAYTVSDDVSPRGRFFLERTSGPDTVITPHDVCPNACVSARQIFEANDSTHYKQNWSAPAYVGNTDWWDAKHLAMLEFTAQTPTAASFGLMQTMYVRAIELGWETTDGRQNPSLLFDTPANAAIGGGSLAIGTLEFYSAYRACNPPDLSTDPDFTGSAAYQSQIVDALNYYNHGHASRNLSYGDNAWAFSQRYLPSHPLSKIFP